MAMPSRTRPITNMILLIEMAHTSAPMKNMKLLPIMTFFLPKRSDPGPESNDPNAAKPIKDSSSRMKFKLFRGREEELEGNKKLSVISGY